MLIEELLLEFDGDDAKKAAKTFVKGAGEFIKGARGGKDIVNPLSGKSVFSYGDEPNEKTTRSIGKNLPPEQQFDNLLKNIYGRNLDDSMKNDWEDAIKSGNKEKIKSIGEKYRDEQKEAGNWKRSNKDVVAALMKHYSDERL